MGVHHALPGFSQSRHQVKFPGQSRGLVERAVHNQFGRSILGGAAFIKGTAVERLYREVLIEQIGGGAESILLDLAGKALASA